MPKHFFQIYDYSQSFAPSVGASAQSDYGLYGKQVDALFNGLSNHPGGTGSLAVRFVSDAGLTYYSNALGASASVTAYIRNKFPITTQASGLGLIDLQSSPDWVHIVGDGIIGASKGSTTATAETSTQQYINGVTTLFGLLSTTYPNIEWAIAGLPYIPYHMTYAPPVGETPAWDASLTNNGNYSSPYWWDPHHPTGNTETLYDWSFVSGKVSDFYTTVVKQGPQNTILSSCNIGWMCPDIRVPYTNSMPFYEYVYNTEANYLRNKKLCTMASDFGDSILVKTYPLISNISPSRKLTKYDDHAGTYTETQKEQFSSFLSITGSSFVGGTSSASDSYYPMMAFRVDTIQAAVDGNVHGFIYQDASPMLIDMACSASLTSGQNGYDMQIRARNLFSNLMFGGAYSLGYEPIAGYTADSVRRELSRYSAYESMGYLNDIRESVNISVNGIKGYGAMKNGFFRSAKNPSSTGYTGNNGLTHISTNTTESDAIYGTQTWTTASLVECPCPVDCELTPYNPLECCCIEIKEYSSSPCVACGNGYVIKATGSTGTLPESCKCPCSIPLIINQGSYAGCCGGPGPPPTCGNGTSCDADACDCAECAPPASLECDPTSCLCNNQDLVSTTRIGNCGGPGGGSFTVIDPLQTENFGLVLSIDNYKKTNSNQFIFARKTLYSNADWYNRVYKFQIESASAKTYYQAITTLLNSVVSVPAIKTHSLYKNHPSHYFSP